MENKSFEITDKEQAIRKGWLLFLILPGVISWSKQILIPDPVWESTITFHKFLFLLFFVVFLYLQYHCVYKKHGTRWLAFNIFFLLPFGFLHSIWSVLESTNPNKIMELVFGIMTIPFYYFSIKLRKINQKIKQQIANPA